MHIFDRRTDSDLGERPRTLDPSLDRYAIVIPTLNARSHLPELLPALDRERTIFIDSSSTDGTAEVLRESGYTVISIDRATFNHGKTRNMCLELCHTEFVIFMTQDARPTGDGLFEALLAPFEDETVAASYARQLPRERAPVLEKLDRHFKYPATSCIQSLENRDRLGAHRTYFLSNSCAAYRLSTFRALGGFIETEIMGEDALYAVKAIARGYKIAYAAEAEVIHSHAYSPLQRLRRYFDTGVYRSSHAYSQQELGSQDVRSGRTYVRHILTELIALKKYPSIAAFLLNAVIDLLGYQLGKNNRKIPVFLKQKLSMHPQYWSH
ncbi:MAG: glycosyltransferase [Cyanobacteria bacterium J06639_1]